jgi:hypothetical protein
MASTNLTKPAASAKYGQLSNPLARAMAETEQSLGRGGDQNHQLHDNTKLFSDALSKTGGSFDFDNFPQNADNSQSAFDQSADWEQQQLEWQNQQKKEALHKKLHDQINPVDLVDVYNAKENQVKKEIDELRKELQLLVQDVKKFDKQVEVTLMTAVGHPGQEGKYYITFFQKLRSFIMLLRQKIKSASTWATQLNGKKKKKAGHFNTGMVIDGAGYEKTSTVQDMMHHERSNAYSGG